MTNGQNGPTDHAVPSYTEVGQDGQARAIEIPALVPGDAAVLHMAAQPVLAGSAEVKALVQRLYTAADAYDGFGCAAPQIGEGKNVFVVTLPYARFAVLNPVIKAFGGPAELSQEGCLSYPGAAVWMPRRRDVTLVFQDENGRAHQITATGMLSKVIQHEVDHLRGRTIMDDAVPALERKDEPKPTAQPVDGSGKPADKREVVQAPPQPRYAEEESDAAS